MNGLAQTSLFTITVDRDPETHQMIARAMGIDTRWYESSDALDAAEGEDEPGPQPFAVFLDARLGVESIQNGALIPRLKDLWPLSPLILTAPAAEADMLTEAMALGADDFITKPFDHHEVMRRVDVRRRALQKRAARETITFGALTIDTLQRSVTSTRGQRFLSPTEVKLVSELAKANGAVVPRDQLKSRCWPQSTVSDNALNRKLYEIRRRLKPICEGISIRTIYGVGFIMEQK